MIETWFDKTEWKVEFSPDRTVCVILRTTGEGIAIPHESYSIRVPEGRIIERLSQIDNREFVYYTANLNGDTRVYYHHRVELKESGTAKHTEFRVLGNAYNFKNGVKAYKRLLKANNLEEAEPFFGPCYLNGLFAYDSERYEIQITSRYLILRDKETGRFAVGETGGMDCHGFEQSEEVILGIFRNAEGRLFLRRFGISLDEGMLVSHVPGLPEYCADWLRNGLELFSLNCQIDSDRIYTLYGDYSISAERIIQLPSAAIESILVKRKGEDFPWPLAVVAECVSEDPKVLALVDPYDWKVAKRAVNLITGEIEEIRFASDLQKNR